MPLFVCVEQHFHRYAFQRPDETLRHDGRTRGAPDFRLFLRILRLRPRALELKRSWTRKILDRQRIDKWLWHARVVRTRTAAAALAAAGHVRLNGARVDAPSRAVKAGDVVTVALDRTVRVLKVLGCVNSASDFIDQPQVINGCSDLLHEIFGAKTDGWHARSALGFVSLPNGVAVEIEAIFEIKD